MNLPAINNIIEKLRSLSHLDLQTTWFSYPGDLPIARGTNPQSWETWTPVILNQRKHVAWEPGKIIWLGQTLVVPEQLCGYPLEGLYLRWSVMWWAEMAQVFVNGECVQEGDLFDCATRIVLSDRVVPGAVFHLALRLISPGHDPGAVVRSLALFEGESEVDPGMFADELQCLSIVGGDRPDFLSSLAEVTATLNWSHKSDRAVFDRQLVELRDRILALNCPPRPHIFLLGHAHLDLAWLWPVVETWEAAQRTFSSVLQLQDDFPELTFGHSTPALYDWLESHRPDLFAAIQDKVKTGQWEIIAGLWVEPEFNIISGESLIRQVLYGQRYIREKFGILNRVAWLPDSFGFCWQLPQIFKLGNIDYFVTQKLDWNDTTQFPYKVFWWEGLDGTQLLSLMSAPIGQGIDSVEYARYSVKWQENTGIEDSLALPGVGDHGGGPSRDMLEVGRRSQLSPILPKLEFTTAHRYLDRLIQQNSYPVWRDELYLEFHRGCYTTHAEQKQYNRRCERLLYEAELWSSCASLLADVPYPKLELERDWKAVLFNQFHDILPGSAIPEVFVDADREWERVIASTKSIIDRAIATISSHLTLPQSPHPDARAILIFNPLNWMRWDVATIPIQNSERCWQVRTSDGEEVASQSYNNALVFLAPDIPSVGYRLFWLVPISKTDSVPDFPTEFILENNNLRVEIDPETGDIQQLRDRQHDRNILKGSGNQLQAFSDTKQYWDAWNIDPNYAQQPLSPTELKSIRWITYGKVVQEIEVIRQFGQSTFTQYYTLFAHKNQLEIRTTVDWQERHTLVKANFPLALNSDYTTYEIPCGAIARSNHIREDRNGKEVSDRDRAKWEVPALNWADLTDDSEQYGVSLISDYKSGYDPAQNHLRLTLLLGATWPDPKADLGNHEFHYAIYPHAGNWQSAQTVRRGYEFNCPLRVKEVNLSEELDGAIANTLPETISFIQDTSNSFILTALKPSEERENEWMIHGYEAHGEARAIHFQNNLGIAIESRVNLLEEKQAEIPAGQPLTVQPWQIIALCARKIVAQSESVGRG
ncbi:alpha-mannosidase [Roseofilum casamattae]|uniref:Alpha-mannosidase n=1 Tax=Roseofilum casamattae BLCC-M143 TaxID=3022442 RepID=A0ABT7C1B1_9CYAN|nr:alpha-mannosidase [Roseofilum casamattae]MDJ1184534.1 alpha-mannosidase [Roseofilum casamattae BLCC-M143]